MSQTRQNSSKNFAKKIRIFLPALCLAALPTAGLAQEIIPCDSRAELDAIPEPWAENSRSFANGEVRATRIDTIEPAATPYYLAILHPPRDLLGARRCTLIGFGSDVGYAALFIPQMTAAYDPARGLTLSLPGRLYVAEHEFGNSLVLHATINQATGTVTATHELGPE